MPTMCFRSINATARVTVWAPNANVIAAAMMKARRVVARTEQRQ